MPAARAIQQCASWRTQIFQFWFPVACRAAVRIFGSVCPGGSERAGGDRSCPGDAVT